MVDQDEIHRIAVGREFLTEVKKLEEIISEIEKQKSFRIFGYLLIPVILGFFVFLMKKMASIDKEIRVAVVGKYAHLGDSYISINEALKHAGIECGENIFILIKKKDELTQKVRNEIEASNYQLKNNLKHLKDADTFLIYSVRADLLGKLEDYRSILHYLKLKNENFEKSFNDIIETSIRNRRQQL
ncbi:MAG: hypothetical protein O8C62_10625 [Candidatus Methanoperedens sp.]|nr:hypothetical protein [Candidatus Methanoperedens sp.]